MDGDGSLQPVGVLQRIMGVIPSRSILQSAKLIGEAILWCNRTLSNPVDSIHMNSILLSDSVPVDARAIFWQLIGDLDLDPLALVSIVDNQL